MGNKSKSETVIYWAAAYKARDTYDLNHLYAEPKSLYSELAAKKAPSPPRDNTNDFLRCPATTDLFKNTFVVRAPVDTNVLINFGARHIKQIGDTFVDESTYNIKLDFIHQPTLTDHNLIDYNHPILFFSEEETMELTLTPPYFDNVNSYRSGVIIPGRFDIAKWFRPVNMEFQLWPGVKTLSIPAGEALCYVHFNTDKKITLKRFIINRDIERLIASIAKVSPFRRYARLSERYKAFEQSQSKQRVLKLIQKQLI